MGYISSNKMDQNELKRDEIIEHVCDVISGSPGGEMDILSDSIRRIMTMGKVREALYVDDSNDTNKVNERVMDILNMNEVKNILMNVTHGPVNEPSPQDTLKKYISKLRSKIEVAERLLLDPSITTDQVNQVINDVDETDDDLLSMVLSSRENEYDELISKIAATPGVPIYRNIFSMLLKWSTEDEHSTDIEDIIDEVD
jgi:hypothetical protein